MSGRGRARGCGGVQGNDSNETGAAVGRARGRGAVARITQDGSRPGVQDVAKDESTSSDSGDSTNRSGIPPQPMSAVLNSSGEPAGVAFARINLSHMSVSGRRRGAQAQQDNDDDVHTRPKHITDKTGTSGRRFEIVSNLFKLNRRPTFHIYQYHVDFEPEVPNKGMRRCMMAEHTDILGSIYEFDGMLCFLPKRLPCDVTPMYSVRKTDNVPISITMKFTKEIESDSTTSMQLFNITFKKVLGIIDMKQIGRNYYSPSQAVPIPQHKLEVWPGYITSILQFESATMLIADLSHKILHQSSVLDIMYEIYEKKRRVMADFREACSKQLIGQIVLTRYNNKTFRIDDINWEGNPLSTFTKTDSTLMTYKDYFQTAHGIPVRDENQPLLLSNPKARDIRRGQDGPLVFLPELCNMTGLSEEVRTDYNVMKDIAQHTRIDPATRVRTLEGFINKIRKNPEAMKQLTDWNLDFAESLLSMTARQMPQESIKQGRNGIITYSYNSTSADWSREVKGNDSIKAENLDHWLVIATQRDAKVASDLVEALHKICPSIGVVARTANTIALSDDSTDTYLRTLRQHINENVQMVVCILPTNRSDRYNAIKNFACIECPVPSQVVLARTLSKSNMLMSVATKIAIQLNCKMGGEIWAVTIPLDHLMVVGIDCYHDSSKKGHSVGAFVASFNKNLTRYYSRCALQSNMQELMDYLNTFMTDALKHYRKVNGRLPDTIIVYRDGVGDGQLKAVHAYEVTQLQASFRTIAADYCPKFAFIVVKKRINSRFFMKTGTSVTNPPPGTVIDTEATRPEWYDFFLVSQSVRQGTVAPTHYNVIHDSTILKPDHHQRLAYKLCHLYYNWPGTIRVPAPCQYAHKLAFLVGQSLHREANNKLFDRLYYL